MNLQEHIRKILKEETLKDTLQDIIDNEDLATAVKLVGGAENLVNILYDGDLKKYYEENDLEPYKISNDNLYIDDLIVQLLDLPQTNSPRPEKILGDFRWTSRGTNYKFTARLYPMNLSSGKKMWRAVGNSGDHGFGYAFITKRNTLGVRAKTQIFQQIIDKYNLDSYK